MEQTQMITLTLRQHAWGVAFSWMGLLQSYLIRGDGLLSKNTNIKNIMPATRKAWFNNLKIKNYAEI